MTCSSCFYYLYEGGKVVNGKYEIGKQICWKNNKEIDLRKEACSQYKVFEVCSDCVYYKEYTKGIFVTHAKCMKTSRFVDGSDTNCPQFEKI